MFWVPSITVYADCGERKSKMTALDFFKEAEKKLAEFRSSNEELAKKGVRWFISDMGDLFEEWEDQNRLRKGNET